LNDPAANSQWASAINAITAWNYSTGGAAGSGVIVAVVDTGIRADHPDLAGKIVAGRDFINCDESNCSGSGLTYFTANDGDGWDDKPDDPGDWVSTQDKAAHTFFANCDTEDSSWHGTRVAGIIGAGTNNGIGIAGIGYNARILPIRALGKCGGYDSDITAGMRWAAGLHVSGIPDNPNPARVINLSLGSADPCNQTYTTVINELKAITPGVSIVASAGNDSSATNMPANCPGVIGVVAIRNAGSKVGFSSLGPEITIAAPGGNCGNGSGPCLFSIDTTTNLGTVDQTQTCPVTGNATAKCRTTPGVNDYTDQLNPNLGTSFSAPIVSGTIALMLGANNSLTPTTITTRLKATATPFPQPELDTNNQPISCMSPSATNASTINSAPCNCTTALCGAGMVNALKAVQSVALPNVVINGTATVAQGGTDTLSAATSTAADGGTLSYAWTVVSGGASLSAANTASTTVTAPNADVTVIVRVTVTDSWSNSASKDFSITVGAGSSSSSSSASSAASSASTSASSTSAAGASSSSAVTVTGATKGGGAIQIEWLLNFAALLMLRARRVRLTIHNK
jgi:serine protease